MAVSVAAGPRGKVRRATLMWAASCLAAALPFDRPIEARGSTAAFGTTCFDVMHAN